MESVREYASIIRHFAGTSDSDHAAKEPNSLQSQVWQSMKNGGGKQYIIEGVQIDPRLIGRKIDVTVADIDVNGQQTKVAVTCFSNPQDGVDVQKPNQFPACRKPIVGYREFWVARNSLVYNQSFSSSV